MSCPNELTLSIYADGELPANEARLIAAHMETCAACQARFASLAQENVVLREALGALDWLWQATPTLPAGFRWVGNLGGLGGAYSLSRGLVELTVGGQDMLVSSFGLGATLFLVLGALGFVALRRPLVGASAAIAFAVLAGLSAPAPAHAAEFRYEEEGTVKVDAGETIDDTVFLAGKTAIVAGTVDGDVFAGAERVEVTGTIRGNLFSAGETVTIAGDVSGNVHAAGKNVDVGAKVGGSGFLAGQNVLLNESGQLARGGFFAGQSVRSKGRVDRSLYFAAEKMEIGGSVERSVRGYGEQVTVSANGSIGGDLHVTGSSEDALEIDEGATIKGETVVDIEEKKERRAFLYPRFYFGVLAKALALLLIGLLLVTLFPSLRPSSPESSREVLRDMGIGFVVLLATPVAMLFIAITVIGIPISMVLGAAYGLLFFLSTLVVAYFLAKRFAPEGDRRLILGTAVTLLVILFIVEIPFIGGGLNFLVHIFGMGCLVLHLWNLYQSRRKPPGAPEPTLS